ncbi:glycoside hydrolase family 25 protein [Pedobacter gandavensis]|uniref:glycoside hydrolase family 25 protein n=1 Tax=Pedobacter gandavensis TaxID=2679963 RepID=UPI002931E168|nr:glycoside hydrolase family 25 protein [Pedobacter gandavensis]
MPLVPPDSPLLKKTPVARKPVTPRKKPAVKPVVKRKVVKKKKAMALEWKFAIVGLMLILLSPFYYGYIIKGFSSTWRWMKDWGQDPNYRTYSSFDIRIPKKHSIHGIDVSYYQGKIDWRKVKAMKEDEVQVKFAFIKATEGILSVDPYFQRNWREAAKAGIVCGAYHFFRPQKSGEWQAKFFLQTVKFEEGDLPPVVDIEQLNGVDPASMRKELQEFIRYVEKKTKVKPIIYSGLTFYKDYLKGHFDEYPLWIAHYHQAKLKVSGDTNWFFWQHSDKARITGINHVVDFNAFNGDSTAFERLRIPKILSY